MKDVTFFFEWPAQPNAFKVDLDLGKSFYAK